MHKRSIYWSDDNQRGFEGVSVKFLMERHTLIRLSLPSDKSPPLNVEADGQRSTFAASPGACLTPFITLEWTTATVDQVSPPHPQGLTKAQLGLLIGRPDWDLGFSTQDGNGSTIWAHLIFRQQLD